MKDENVRECLNWHGVFFFLCSTFAFSIGSDVTSEYARLFMIHCARIAYNTTVCLLSAVRSERSYKMKKVRTIKRVFGVLCLLL